MTVVAEPEGRDGFLINACYLGSRQKWRKRFGKGHHSRIYDVRNL